MNKHLYNSGVEKPFLSMTGNLGDLIMLNTTTKISMTKTT